MINEVLIKRLDARAKLPARAHVGDVGYDLCSVEQKQIRPRRWIKIKTGLQFQLPSNLEAQIRPRSGLALRSGITVLNSPGTIDSGYRGEICVILINHSTESFMVKQGDRIAQVVFSSVCSVDLAETDIVDETSRGNEGFGSTGQRPLKN